MKKRLFYLVLAVSTLPICAQQQKDSLSIEKLEEVIITATKIPTKKKNLGKIVYQISKEVITRNQGRSVVDLLNEVPGIEINGNFSTKGQNLGYYLRGGRNRQVAILIDGVNVNDPSSFNGDFDLRQIPLEQIESIEVLKGAASTLYGSGAATGVINIILKNANSKQFEGSFLTYFGTNNSQEDQGLDINELNSNFNFNGKLKKVDYLLSFNGAQSKGLSAAESDNHNISYQEDPFYRFNTLLKLGYNVKDNFRLGFFGVYDEFTSNYDQFDFISNSYVDANNSLKSVQKRIGFTPNFTYKKGELKLNAFYTIIDRNIDPSSDKFKGEAFGFDIFNNYNISKEFSILTGLTAQYQDMYQKTAYASIEEGSANQYFYDPYMSLNYYSDSGFNLNVGARLNMHNEYGNNMVYNINPSFNFKIFKDSNLKLLASYSTAFVAPTLQEIFNKLPSIDKLNPEYDITMEGGFEMYISPKFFFNTVYFYREETDKIGFDYVSYQTINDIGKFFARGVESEVIYSPLNTLSFTLNYAYIHRDKSLLLKIPQHKIGVKMVYKLNDKTQMSLHGKFVDKTSDFGGVELPSYRIVDAFMNHTLIDHRLTVFGSITNVLNENYQEIAGFSTRGRNYKLGVRLHF